jgi:subtilisin family serine protease
MKVIGAAVVHLLLLAPHVVHSQLTKQLRHGFAEQENGRNVTGGEKRRFLKKKNDGKKQKKRVVVRYKSSGGKVALLQDQERKIYHDFDEDNVIVLDLDDDEIEQMSLNEDIEAVEHDYRYEEMGHFVRELNEAEARKLGETVPYGITMVQANQVSFGSTSVKVCLADTGVIHHPDLPRNMAGADRTSSSGSAIYWDGDKRGHGTHTAGTVAARKGNGIGVVGVAPGASLFVTRALDDVGSARESDIYQAIKQCADAGAKVISLSLGGGGISSSFKSLLDKLYYEKNIVIVAGTWLVHDKGSGF